MSSTKDTLSSKLLCSLPVCEAPAHCSPNRDWEEVCPQDPAQRGPTGPPGNPRFAEKDSGCGSLLGERAPLLTRRCFSACL